MPHASTTPGTGRPLRDAPVLAITQGDPCGIGPEIIVRALASLGDKAGPCVVVASVQALRRALRQTGVALPLWVLDDPVDGLDDAPPGTLVAWEPPGLPSLDDCGPQGRVSAAAGAMAAACIDAATSLAVDGRVAGLVTAPIHKEALAQAGRPFPGHTEMLQHRAGGVPVRMMLANQALRTVLVSIHVSLQEAIARVTLSEVLETIRIADRSARAWGLASPRIAVAGLNPHAGEGGLFGREEIDQIRPAVEAARQAGIDCTGPHAPDTVFMRARHDPPGHPGEFDVVVAMYHDQGLIPVKYLGLDEGVNVTLGLPFVRTSPDHGTAFDLAGTGRAEAHSLIAALRMARELAGRPGGP